MDHYKPSAFHDNRVEHVSWIDAVVTRKPPYTSQQFADFARDVLRVSEATVEAMRTSNLKPMDVIECKTVEDLRKRIPILVESDAESIFDAFHPTATTTSGTFLSETPFIFMCFLFDCPFNSLPLR